VAYITGFTNSPDFPVENPYQSVHQGDSYDVFVAALTSSGSALIYSTYLGGGGIDMGHGISLGTDGMAYVVGNTASSDFPVENAYQAAMNGAQGDLFISVLTSAGSHLTYSTYLGGSGYESAVGISLGTDAAAYVVGRSWSEDFPTLNPYQAAKGGGKFDTVVLALTPTGSALTYSTYLGGSGLDWGSGISLGTDATAYLTGFTTSTDFPMENAYQAVYGGGDNDIFVTALDSAGSALAYSSYLGGSEDDRGSGISLGTDATAYISGYTDSTDFPVENAYQAAYGGGDADIFVTAFNSAGTGLVYSTYLGGGRDDRGNGISLGTDDTAYVVGYTDSSDFPTKNPYQSSGSWDEDGFVSRFTLAPDLPWITDYNGDGTSDIAIFRESSGLWAIRGISRVYFGMTGDIPEPGDYDGDGTTDVGLYRPSSGLWALRGVSRIYFGGSSDEPIPADYDGNGTAEPAIFRPSSGLWAVRGVTRSYFGGSGDGPIPGYYSGLGDAAIAIFRPASGLWAFKGVTRIYFGAAADDPVPGDYDGDGAWRPGIFRESSGLWALANFTRSYFGGGTDWPIPGEYSGDGTDDIGIFRESSGLWAIRGVTRVYFGTIGDIPVTR